MSVDHQRKAVEILRMLAEFDIDFKFDTGHLTVWTGRLSANKKVKLIGSIGSLFDLEFLGEEIQYRSDLEKWVIDLSYYLDDKNV